MDDPPMASNLTVTTPPTFIVPTYTVSPTPLCAGRDSPVRDDSSNLLDPEMIVPSPGGVDPFGTLTMSPTSNRSVDTRSSSEPMVSRIASVGRRPASILTASAAFPLVYASKYRPVISHNAQGVTYLTR